MKKREKVVYLQYYLDYYISLVFFKRGAQI